MPPKSSYETIRKLELRLDADKDIEHDKSLRAIRELLKTGIRLLASIEERERALIDSETRLERAMQELPRSTRNRRNR